jgi:tetratricopeptide (TPR) repeat protein
MRFIKSISGSQIILIFFIIFFYTCALSVSGPIIDSKLNNDLTNKTDLQYIYSLKINKLNDKIYYYVVEDTGSMKEYVYKMTGQDHNNIKSSLNYYTTSWSNSSNGNTVTLIFRDNGERMDFKYSSGDYIEILPYKFKIYFFNKSYSTKNEVALDTKFRGILAALSRNYYKTAGNGLKITLPGRADIYLANGRQFASGSDGELLKRGNEYFDKMQYQEAITQYSKALNLNPKFPAAYFNRGLAYYYLQQYDQAITDFSKHLELSPVKTSLRMRGVAYARQDRFQKALVDLRRYLEVTSPQDKEVLENIESLEHH